VRLASFCAVSQPMRAAFGTLCATRLLGMAAIAIAEA